MKIAFKKLVKNKCLWGEDDGYAEMSVIPGIFKDFVITSIETGPDDGSIELLSDDSISKIKKLLKIEV